MSNSSETKQVQTNFLVNRIRGNRTKKFYSREEDEQIVRLLKQGKSIPEVAKAVGHSAPSVTYRVTQKLSLMRSFDEYDYSNHRIRLSKDEIKSRLADAQAKAAAKQAPAASAPKQQATA